MTGITPTVSRGYALPLGVHAVGEPGAQERSTRHSALGLNVSIWAPQATTVEFCVFTSTGEERFVLPFRDGGIRFAHIAGFGVGTRYGLRVDGLWDPASGHYANRAKLLIDPYARIIESPVRWHPLMSAFTDHGDADSRDSAAVVPKCVVAASEAPLAPNTRTDSGSVTGIGASRSQSDLIIYEAHLRGLTAAHPDIPDAQRGTYVGMAHPIIVNHLRDLGVTAVELLPLQTFLDDRFLVNRGFTNYWGYQPINWFSAEPRYATDGTGVTADRELRELVRTLHNAGIEVFLDVVYNHSGEGDELGPTLSLRGLDNNGYYRMNGARYTNNTGTGNTLAVDHPQTLRLVTDSLRHWVTHFGIDGFRFDLAATLGRRKHNDDYSDDHSDEHYEDAFDPSAAFFQSLAQDPILSQVRLIAEPWDIGPGGYQLGQFPWPWSEWNDRFRDGVRRLWRGETPGETNLGSLLLGSADLMSHPSRSLDSNDHASAIWPARAATTSVNFVSAHDGFTLHDVVAYSTRHNDANGEGGRDGHGENFSDNMGVEGPTTDSGIVEARARRVRAMLATLLLSQGTPMLLAGDELGNSQGGNNNAYVQDSEIGWVNWCAADAELIEFTRRLIALRSALPVLRQAEFLHGTVREDGYPDISWYRADGVEASRDDWHDPQHRVMTALLRAAAGGSSLGGGAVSVGDGGAVGLSGGNDGSGAGSCGDKAVLIVINPGGDAAVTLPNPGKRDVDAADSSVHDADHLSSPWRFAIDTARPVMNASITEPEVRAEVRPEGVDSAGETTSSGLTWNGSGPYPTLAQSVVVFFSDLGS